MFPFVFQDTEQPQHFILRAKPFLALFFLDWYVLLLLVAAVLPFLQDYRTATALVLIVFHSTSKAFAPFCLDSSELTALIKHTHAE